MVRELLLQDWTGIRSNHTPILGKMSYLIILKRHSNREGGREDCRNICMNDLIAGKLWIYSILLFLSLDRMPLTIYNFPASPSFNEIGKLKLFSRCNYKKLPTPLLGGGHIKPQ